MNKFLVISIVIGLIYVPTLDFSFYFYICLIPTYLSSVILNRQLQKHSFYSIQGLVTSFYLLVWSYGFIRGFVMGNQPIAIISNFAGMVVYAHFLLIKTDKISINKMLIIVFWIGGINLLTGFLYTAYLMGSSQSMITIASIIGGQSRFFYSANIITVFCMIFVSLADSAFQLNGLNLIVGKSNVLGFLLKSELGYYVMVIYYVIIPFGKGFILNFIFIIAFLPVVSFIRFQKVRKLVIFRLLFAVVVIGLLIYKSDAELNDTFLGNFGFEAAGNTIRAEQSKALLDEASLFGAGLGASLKSEYTRDTLGYGFEQSYENVIHKFGVPIGCLILLAYFFIMAKSLRDFVKSWDVISAFGFAASFGLLIPSSGNPMLFAPAHVLIHVLSISILQHNSCQQRYGRSRKLLVENSRI
jgi:hypothetical protein